MTRLGLSAVAILLLLRSPAHAYLDAGSGSLILQTLLAGVGGLLVFLRLRWNRLFKKNKDKEPGP